MAALWPPMAPLCILLGSILGAIFIIFLILFRTHQNLDFAIPYRTFACFKHPKIVRPHFGTPFGRAFWPTLAAKGADLASPCRFWTLFRTPLGSKMGPWSDQGRPWVLMSFSWALLGRSWSLLNSPWAPLVSPWAPLGTHWAALGRSCSLSGTSWGVHVLPSAAPGTPLAALWMPITALGFCDLQFLLN